MAATDRMKPATPLPWHVTHQRHTDQSFDVVSLCTMGGATVVAATGKSADAMSPNGRDAAYIVAECNAYPQLVEDRRRLVEALREVYAVEEGPGETDRPQWVKIRALLKELGEAD